MDLPERNEKMQTIRLNRVKELIKEEVSNIILLEMKDPRLGIVTITDIELSPDLRHCKIFISTLDEEEAKDAVKVLNNAAGYIRYHIKKRVRLKFIPEFSFVYDNSLLRGTNVLQVIEKLKEER